MAEKKRREKSPKRKKRKTDPRVYYSLLFLGVVLLYGLTALGVRWIEEQPVSRLERPQTGQEIRTEELLVDDGQEKRRVTVEVSPRELTAEELQVLFQAAEKELAEGLPGDNDSLERVTKPLYMPDTAQEGQVTVSWSSDQPEYLSYDGTLGEDIPLTGVTVSLEAALSCQEEIWWYKTTVTVLPETEEGEMAELQAALAAADEDKTKTYYTLPSALGQQALVWYRSVDNPGIILGALLLLMGILLPLRRIEEEKKARERYRHRLLLAYPRMVSQITLYLGAGMSLRQTFTCMAGAKGKKRQDVLETECSLLVRELAQGMPEAEAIRRLGERSGLWEYRTFCGLLMQHRAKGNRDLLPMLQKEAEKAFAERQRRARILGNEAGTRLLMPMMLMLLVVLILVLFPAMVSFYA